MRLKQQFIFGLFIVKVKIGWTTDLGAFSFWEVEARESEFAIGIRPGTFRLGRRQIAAD